MDENCTSFQIVYLISMLIFAINGIIYNKIALFYFHDPAYHGDNVALQHKLSLNANIRKLNT